MSLTSLLSTRQSSNKSKCGHKLHLSIPLLCDIAENSTLRTVSPTASIEKIFKEIYKQDKKVLQLEHDDIQLNADAVEFIPTCPDTSNDQTKSVPDTRSIHDQTETTYKITSKFIPKHKPRAKYNIYIGKSETRNILSDISEHFPTTSTLYYYLDVLTAFQMNDNQMNIFQIINQPKITFINLDLHRKHTNELLYASIIPNDKHRIAQANKNNNKLENTKWLWKLNEFLTAKEIFEKYNINPNDLPKSSRKIHKFYKYINKQEYINSNILYNIDWSHSNIRQIGPVKKSAKFHRNQFKINSKNFIRQCKQSWNNFVAVPIIVYENKDDTGFKYRCEWVKIVEINGSFVGISFCKANNQWKLQSVYLDKMDIENKHRLFGINRSKYTNIFNQFATSILEIKWL